MNLPARLRASRTALVSAALLAGSLATGAARADDTDECLAASDAGQKERDAGRLVEAQKALLRCSRDVCPRIVRNDCVKWLSDVEERTPSVVFGARDGHGSDIVDVQVEVDGKVVASKLDGRALPLNPGEHRVRFLRDGSSPIEQTVMTREREKGRALQADFAAPEAPAGPEHPVEASSGGGAPVAAYLAAGVGVLGLGSFAYFGLTGSNDASSLRNTCAPRCADSAVSDVRSKLLIADISLGVGVVSLGVAGYLLFLAPHGDGAPAASAARPASHPAPRLSFDLVPARGGQMATLSGAF
jgi:hypothetical protein